MIESMVERVAAVLADNVSPRCYDDRCTCSGYERWNCIVGMNPQDVVRLLMAAMREPTEAMVLCGSNVTWWDGEGDEEWEENVAPSVAKEIYQAHIDEALK